MVGPEDNPEDDYEEELRREFKRRDEEITFLRIQLAEAHAVAEKLAKDFVKVAKEKDEGTELASLRAQVQRMEEELKLTREAVGTPGQCGLALDV